MKKKGNAVRTTITLNPLVNLWAEELRTALGYNSLSDLICELIRQRKLEYDREQKSGAYPAPRAHNISLNEKTDKPKP